MKKCFKCNKVKPLSEFYVHRMMADGHLGKCKDCAKTDVEKRLETCKLDPEWMVKERARCRKKSEQYRALGMSFAKRKQSTTRKYRNNNRLKTRVHTVAACAVKRGAIKRLIACERCGASGVRLEKHHEDYSKPLSVVWLCCKCHGITKRKS